MLKAVAFLKGVDRLCQTNLHNPSNMCLGPDVHIQQQKNKHLPETTHKEGKAVLSFKTGLLYGYVYVHAVYPNLIRSIYLLKIGSIVNKL